MPLEQRTSPRAQPETHVINVQQATDTLDYDEMISLSAMYDRWAFAEESLAPEHRTRLVQLSADYESIAQHVGPSWIAPDATGRVDAVQFVARLEKRDQQRRSAMRDRL